MKKENLIWSLGIDLGGTKIEVAAVDHLGQILKKERRMTPVEQGVNGVVEEICSMTKKMMSHFESSPLGIGIGIPGQVDPDHGIVHFAPNLNWHHVPLGTELKKRLGRSVVIAEDVRSAAWGEWKYGAAQGCQNFVCLFIGTGIGGGIVSEGKMVRGFSNTAGELGHMTLDLRGPECTCGNWGCFEALAGGWAIARQAEKAILLDPSFGVLIQKLAEKEEGKISARMVIEAFFQGDELALTIISGVYQAVAAGAISIVNALNPQRLIFGGGIVEGLPDLVKFVENEVRQRALSAASESLQILTSQLKGDAGVIGAASYAASLQEK